LFFWDGEKWASQYNVGIHNAHAVNKENPLSRHKKLFSADPNSTLIIERKYETRCKIENMNVQHYAVKGFKTNQFIVTAFSKW